jgi:HD-GYP domain-containing protein (c-di-GMP phosphodiesterase class II)
MQSETVNQSGAPRIAIAVGDASQRKQVARELTPFYQVAEYSDMSRALAGCRLHWPRVIVVSEQLHVGDGYDLVRMLRLDRHLATVPALILVAKADRRTHDRVIQCGADGLLVYPSSQNSLVTAVSGLVNRSVEREWTSLQPAQRRALVDTLHLFNKLADSIAEGKPILYQSVSDACIPLIQIVASNDFRGMLQGLRDHDNYTYVHSIRVATYLALFGFKLHLSKQEQLLLASGGLIHDVGKTTIPHAVLNKPGRLNADERAVMRGHVNATMAYLECCPDLPKGIITIAAQHHEKVDGSGYPLGIAGTKLNRLARIASIVDVFTALTDRRVYKAPLEPEAALNIMADEMASQLDMKLLGLFRQMLLDATPSLPAELARPA